MTINDIHSYTVFVNIDKRNGKIEGHQVILSKEAIELIEDIILEDWEDTPKVLELSSYEWSFKKNTPKSQKFTIG